METEAFSYQTAFNIAFSIAGLLGGWLLRSLSERLRDLQVADASLAEKVQAIEVVVAGEYVKIGYFEKRLDQMQSAIFHKLDRIENAVNNKADKP